MWISRNSWKATRRRGNGAIRRCLPRCFVRTAGTTTRRSRFNKEETNWTNAKANKLVRQAVATVDVAKRTELAHEAQAIQWKEGGYVIWGYGDSFYGAQNNVMGLVPRPGFAYGEYHFELLWLS